MIRTDDPELPRNATRGSDFADALRLSELMDLHPEATAAQMLEIVRNVEGESQLFREIAAALREGVKQ